MSKITGGGGQGLIVNVRKKTDIFSWDGFPYWSLLVWLLTIYLLYTLFQAIERKAVADYITQPASPNYCSSIY